MTTASQNRRYRIATGAFFYLQGIVFFSWASRIPDITYKLGISDATFGAVLMIMPIAQFVTMAGAGYLISRKGSRWTLTLAALLYPLFLFFVGAASSLPQLCVALAGFGILGNLSNLSVNAEGLNVERLYGKNILSTFHGIWSLGAFSGAGLGYLMVRYCLSPLTHYFMIYGLALLLVWTLSPWLPADKQASATEAVEQRRIKPDRLTIMLGLIAFCAMICEGTMVDWIGIYFDRMTEDYPRLIGLGLALFMTPMTTGRFLADGLSTRLSNVSVICLSACLTAAGLLLIIAFPSLPLTMAGIALTGLGVSSLVPLCYSQVGKSTRQSPGMALAWISSIGFLGFFVGPPAVGFLSQQLGLRFAFVLTLLLACLMIALVPFVKRKILEKN